jgi:hypothetical protein
LTFAKAHGSRSPRRDVPKFQSNYTKVALTARRPSANRRDPASRLRRLQRRRLSNAAPRSYWRKTMTIYARGPRRRTEPPRQPLARAALALLPSPTRTRGQPRRRMAARTLGSRADPGHGEPSARGDDRQTAQTASHPPLRRRFRGQHVVQAAGARRRRNSRSRERLTGPGELRTVDPVAVRLARRKTECWANVSQCPVYVDSCRSRAPLGGQESALSRHSGSGTKCWISTTSVENGKRAQPPAARHGSDAPTLAPRAQRFASPQVVIEEAV